MGPAVEPNELFLAFTVDQGGNVAKAVENLGIPCLKCYAHRLNTAVMWALGIGGSGERKKNKPVEELLKKLAALVGVFSHSPVNNDRLRQLQELEESLSTVHELVRRNDTG